MLQCISFHSLCREKSEYPAGQSGKPEPLPTFQGTLLSAHSKAQSADPLTYGIGTKAICEGPRKERAFSATPSIVLL